MKALMTLYLSVFLFGELSADAEYDKKKREGLGLRTCVACGPVYIQNQFDVCNAMLSDKAKAHKEVCFDKVKLPKTDRWLWLCQHPVENEAAYDCIYTDKAYFASLTEDELKARERFLACIAIVEEKYCPNPQFFVSSNGPNFSSTLTTAGG